MAYALRDWEPWRDATPKDWREAKLARPRKPPKKPLAREPERPPLDLAVMDTPPAPYRDEPLPRAHAPWLQPSRVERWDGEAWVDDDRARKVLGRTSAYLPAGWVDQIDDSQSVTGRLRVTYPAGPPRLTRPVRRVLTARATPPREVWWVNGQPALQLNALGRYAIPHPETGRWPHGVYPWAVLTPIVSAPNEPLTFELDLRGSKLAQLLLALSGPTPQGGP